MALVVSKDKKNRKKKLNLFSPIALTSFYLYNPVQNNQDYKYKNVLSDHNYLYLLRSHHMDNLFEINDMMKKTFYV